jgi:hypothetical protein
MELVLSELEKGNAAPFVEALVIGTTRFSKVYKGKAGVLSELMSRVQS